MIEYAWMFHDLWGPRAGEGQARGVDKQLCNKKIKKPLDPKRIVENNMYC